MNAVSKTNEPARQAVAYYQEIRTTEPKCSEEEKTVAMNKHIGVLLNGADRYHKMIEEVEDYAILLLDVNGIVQNWNKGAEKIKGYKDNEIVGKSFRLFYREEDKQSGLPEQLLREATEKGKAIHEGWRVRKDGTYFWGSVVITSLHDGEGNILGFSKVTRDLTERKKIENQLTQYAADLEFQNKELQQFTYAAAHDMKEPLRKVQFYNSSVLDKCGHLLPEKERSYLARSVEAAKRMQRLIDDLLTYANTANNNEQFVPCNLDTVLQDTIANVSEGGEQGVISVDVISPLPVVQGIPFQLNQLFANILGNAIKYRHPERAVKIVIDHELADETPGRPYIAGKQYHKITIQDNGIGFAPEYAERIFDLFMRLHDKSHYQGTGIGLAICKKIVQQHQGELYATGYPGEGARFTAYLPTNEI